MNDPFRFTCHNFYKRLYIRIYSFMIDVSFVIISIFFKIGKNRVLLNYETKSKRNETKLNETKYYETQRNETKYYETQRGET